MSKLITRRAPFFRCAAALLVIAVVLTLSQSADGRAALADAQRFLTFYAGVFALVGATATVGIGLVSTDRLLASIRLRVLAQQAHRLLAVLTIIFLITHIVLEIAAARAGAADSVLPFLASHRTATIGMGTIASDLLILIAVTGVLRRRFAQGPTPRAWRVVHVTAYLAWPLSIAHGLLAGRTPKPYVVWSYWISLAAVAVALAVRLLAMTWLSRAPRHRPQTIIGS